MKKNSYVYLRLVSFMIQYPQLFNTQYYFIGKLTIKYTS